MLDPINGHTAPGFELVRDEFLRNFVERGELGSACAAVIRGEPVVDLWGGVRDESSREPWERDTLALIFSTTKGLAATAMVVAHARGWLELDAPVARYWPEFAQCGKHAITVRQLLMHRAGLAVVRERLTPSLLADHDALAVVLARQRPAWPPGDAHGYHAISLGFFLNELMRRIDPHNRVIGRFLREEVNPALGTDLHIGLPHDVPASRVATVRNINLLRALAHVRTFPPLAAAAMLLPWSGTYRALMNPALRRPGDLAGPVLRHVEMPSANGLATARDLAVLFGDLAIGGPRLGLNDATRAELTTRPQSPPAGPRDRIVHMSIVYSAFGYFMPGPGVRFGTSRRAFGSPGAGGSFSFAEPELGLGCAYTSNRMGYHLFDDPREKSLRDAVIQCARRSA